MSGGGERPRQGELARPVLFVALTLVATAVSGCRHCGSHDEAVAHLV